MLRGEVWLVDFGGRVGRRPALVLTRDPTASRIGSPTVAACTTHGRGLRSEVSLSPEEDGVREDCVVNLDNLSTTPRSTFEHRITTLSPSRMAEVCTALNIALGCHT